MWWDSGNTQGTGPTFTIRAGPMADMVKAESQQAHLKVQSQEWSLGFN